MAWKERCSCGAKIEITYGASSRETNEEYQTRTVEKWRKEHVHEMSDPAEEPARLLHPDLHSDTDRIPGPIYAGFRPDEPPLDTT